MPRPERSPRPDRAGGAEVLAEAQPSAGSNSSESEFTQ